MRPHKTYKSKWNTWRCVCISCPVLRAAEDTNGFIIQHSLLIQCWEILLFCWSHECATFSPFSEGNNGRLAEETMMPNNMQPLTTWALIFTANIKTRQRQGTHARQKPPWDRAALLKSLFIPPPQSGAEKKLKQLATRLQNNLLPFSVKTRDLDSYSRSQNTQKCSIKKTLFYCRNAASQRWVSFYDSESMHSVGGAL